MRITFVNALIQEAKHDRRIVLLSGDLGYSVFEEFIQTFPKQFINAGVAEQNMVGVAAGLAMEGKIPIVYSIVPFATMRPFEQIRNDVCYQDLNVKIVSVGAGFSYGAYGHTHHGLEDIGILRTLPNMVILAPGDPIEAAWATRAMLKYQGPVYLRLGKSGEPTIYPKAPHLIIGKGSIVRRGNDISIIATSTLVERGLLVAERLKKRGIDTELISMHTLKPIDKRLILERARHSKVLITLEEHSVIGGLGSAVSEVLADHSIGIRFKRIGVPDRFTKGMGLQEHMRMLNGLSIDTITKTILMLLKKI